MAGTAEGLLEALHGLAAAAIVGPVARGRQLSHGFLTYNNIPELWQDAVRWTIEGGESLTPANIRRNAERVMDSQEAMIKEELGINYNELGHRIEEDPLVPPPTGSYAREYQENQERRRRAAAEAEAKAAEFNLDDPNFPF